MQLESKEREKVKADCDKWGKAMNKTPKDI